MSPDGKPARGRMIIFTDSARKETRIKIGHQHDRWMKLKDTLREQIHAAV